MRPFFFFRFLAAAGIGAVASSASAGSGDILQDSSNFFSQIQFFSPIGQTFTAERERYIRAAVTFSDCNAHVGDPEIGFELRAGSGTSGTLLASQTRTDTAGMNFQWLEFDVSGVQFTVGNVYTMIVSSPTARGCLHENVLTVSNPPPGPDYPGGAELYEGTVSPDRGDLRFYVIFLDHVFADGFESVP